MASSGLQLVTPATAQLFDIEKLRNRIRANSDQDTIIADLVDEACEKVGDDTRRQLLTATYLQSERAFDDEIALKKAPVQSVSSISYLGTDASWHTVDPTVYRLANCVEPCIVTPAINQKWPLDVATGPDVVKIQFVAGWTTADLVPRGLRGAVAMLVGHWLEHPEAVIHGVNLAETPLGYEDAVVQHYYVWEF